MDESLAREILIGLHHQVLPNMTRGRAIRTADWLGEWVDRGGPLGLLALNGLFILIQDYNLDYPDFYHRLYAMLDRSVLHVKYRARFFRLTEVFLSSSHLPASLIASFIKRLARLSLSAPPAAIIMVIPFIYNLLKLHPSCMVLIHRSTFGGVEPSLNPTAEDLKGESPSTLSLSPSLSLADGPHALPHPPKPRPLRPDCHLPTRVSRARLIPLGDRRPPETLPPLRQLARQGLQRGLHEAEVWDGGFPRSHVCHGEPSASAPAPPPPLPSPL